MRPIVDRWFLRALLVGLAATAGAAEPGWKPDPLPRDEEIAAALEAGPPAMAEGAGVYALTAGGFELVRESRNGFHCLVARGVPGAFEPQCFDAEASATAMQETLLETGLRMAGRSDEEVEREVARAWAEGRLRAPAPGAVNYMLSPRNRVPVDDAGTVRPYRPHVMIHVPYRRNADVGVDPGDGAPVFVVNEGTPGALLIIPIP